MTITLSVHQQSSPPRSLYIGDTRSGDIWKSLEYKKIISGYTKQGTLLKLFLASLKNNQIQKGIVINSICFSFEYGLKEEGVSYCYLAAIGDQRGNIYILDFVKNKQVLADVGIG